MTREVRTAAVQTPIAQQQRETRSHGVDALLDRGRRDDRRRRRQGNPRARRGRVDRPRRRRAASALRAAAAHEGPVGGSGRGEDLARHGGGGRCAAAGPSHRLARPRPPPRDGRPRRGVRLGEAAARDGRPPAHHSGHRGRRLLPDARRLPGGAGADARGRKRRRDRWRLHRLGARGLAGGERLPGDDDLPGARDRIARAAGGAVRLRDRASTEDAASRY